MSGYDPERDPVRIAGRILRWAILWVAVPAAIGVFISGNIELRSLPIFGPERETAVLLLDGQAYFGHLDDSGESGTLVLRDAYYFQDAKSGPTNLPVGLVKRGAEAHEPADGMRINRDKVLALEQVGPLSPVAQAIQAERQIVRMSPSPLALNRAAIASPNTVAVQRIAAEHDIQRAHISAVGQLVKLNELVLPISKAEAQTITDRTITDFRTVRRNALAALAGALGMSAGEVDAYVRNTDQLLEGQAFANEPGVLLAPHLNMIVNRAAQLYTQVGDAAAKQLTQARPSPSPSPTAKPSAKP
jgi:hypothetical protein